MNEEAVIAPYLAENERLREDRARLRAALDDVQTIRDVVAEALTYDRPTDWIGYGAIVTRLDDLLAAARDGDDRWTQEEIDSIKARVQETKDLMGWNDPAARDGDDV